MPEQVRQDAGVLTLRFEHWEEFVDHLLTSLLDEPDFVWRGQCAKEWELEPGLDRILRLQGLSPQSLVWAKTLFRHLDRFKLASRGRSDLDPRALEERITAKFDESTADDVPRATVAEKEENNWWAVGQHYGLVTPLLDWTTSPFVAAFFAYLPPDGADVLSPVVFGLHRRLVEQRSDELREEAESGRQPVVDFIDPLYKGNSRLVSQSGLFTRAPDGISIKNWVQNQFNGSEDEVWLLEMELPGSDRETVLKSLNRMNINQLSLFPDLYGATKFVNLHLSIERY